MKYTRLSVSVRGEIGGENERLAEIRSRMIEDNLDEMTNERWQQFVDLAEDQFENAQVTSEDIIVQTEDGPQKQGTVDILTFDRAGDSYKLERENKPLVLEKKMHFAKRASDTARTEYILSDTEFSHKLRVYKENMNGDWDEISTESLGL